MTRAMEEGEIETKKAKAARPIDQDPLYIQLEERMQRVIDERDRARKVNEILVAKIAVQAARIKELESVLPVPEDIEDLDPIHPNF